MIKKNKLGISIFGVFLVVVSFGTFLYAMVVHQKTPALFVEPSSPVEVEESKDRGGNATVLGEKTEELPTVVKKEVPPLPQVTALSYVVYDVVNDKIAAEKSSDLILPPASTTKIMTALVALEEYNIYDVLPVPKECLNLEGNQAYLVEGDSLSVESLLYALLLPSASDAACVIARGHGNHAEFLAKMNAKAKALGLEERTNFENEIGLDSDNGNHFSTAKDLLIMAKEAMRNQELMKIVSSPYYDVRSYTTGKIYRVQNTNEFLSSLPGTVGIKTGTTEKAGGCFVFAYINTSKNKEVIIVVLGSQEESRFTDTKSLLDWYLGL